MSYGLSILKIICAVMLFGPAVSALLNDLMAIIAAANAIAIIGKYFLLFVCLYDDHECVSGSVLCIATLICTSKACSQMETESTLLDGTNDDDDANVMIGNAAYVMHI